MQGKEECNVHIQIFLTKFPTLSETLMELLTSTLRCQRTNGLVAFSVQERVRREYHGRCRQIGIDLFFLSLSFANFHPIRRDLVGEIRCVRQLSCGRYCCRKSKAAFIGGMTSKDDKISFLYRTFLTLLFRRDVKRTLWTQG